MGYPSNFHHFWATAHRLIMTKIELTKKKKSKKYNFNEVGPYLIDPLPKTTPSNSIITWDTAVNLVSLRALICEKQSSCFSSVWWLVPIKLKNKN